MWRDKCSAGRTYFLFKIFFLSFMSPLALEKLYYSFLRLWNALSKLHWKPLDRRRTEHRAIFMFKVVNNLFMHTFHCSFNSNYHNYNTRSKRNIRKSSAHRRWGHWITSNFAADAWNALPLSLRDVPTLSQFKRGIKKALF